MRRLITPFVVVGVGLVGALAAADALRGHEPEATSPGRGTTTRERPPTVADTLREELVFGLVFYSDEDCRVHSLLVPQMIDDVIEEGGQELIRCRFGSTDGWILKEDERLSPNWRFIARCSGGEILVREAETRVVRKRIEGCAPAWRPRIGNRLTWARGEAIYERGRPLLTRDDLHAIARRHPNIAQLGAPFRVRVADLAWMDLDRLVASLEIRGRYVPREYLAVLLEGKTVVGQATTFQDRLGRWFASAAGSYAAASEGTMLTDDGTTIPRPDGLPAGRAVAFSPDERWLAYVTGRSVYLIGTPRNNEPGRIIRIPLLAGDLAWERITTSPTVPTAIR
jgi:hypothetical protein